jgi:hypothetical protein
MPNPLNNRVAGRSSELPNQSENVNRPSDALPEKSQVAVKKLREHDATPSKAKFPEIEPFFSLY